MTLAAAVPPRTMVVTVISKSDAAARAAGSTILMLSVVFIAGVEPSVRVMTGAPVADAPTTKEESEPEAMVGVVLGPGSLTKSTEAVAIEDVPKTEEVPVPSQ